MIDVLREDGEQKAIFLGIELGLEFFPLFWGGFGGYGHGVDAVVGQEQHVGLKNIIYRIKSCELFTVLREIS